MVDKPCVNGLIAKARENPNELETLFVWYRPYLKIRALGDPRLKQIGAKLDGSDITQETLSRANARFTQFRGDSEPQFTAWIHRILQRTIDDALRKFLGPTRDVSREEPLYAGDESASLVFGMPIADGKTGGSNAVQGEEALLLASAISQLPEAQAEAVRLRYLQAKSLKDLATALEKSESAAAGLLKRGTQKLRELLGNQLDE